MFSSVTKHIPHNLPHLSRAVVPPKPSSSSTIADKRRTSAEMENISGSAGCSGWIMNTAKSAGVIGYIITLIYNDNYIYKL